MGPMAGTRMSLGFRHIDTCGLPFDFLRSAVRNCGSVTSGGKRLPRAQYSPRSTLCSWLARSSFGRRNQVTPEPSQR
jgi:hypothetical protein